jgi:type I restriction enzyme S subunit
MTSDWGSLRLGDHCLKIGSGATPRGGKESYQAEGPYALIRSQNIYNDGFQTTGLAFISNEQAEKLNNVAVAIGDVLLNITGDSVARVCMAPKKFPNARVNQHVAIIRPNPDVFDSRFLKYFLTSPAQQESMLSSASVGGTRNALTKGMIEDFLVAHPSIHEQRNIANLLAGFDSCIAELQVENTTLESLAQTLFRSWFVDFDPVHAKVAGDAPEALSEKLAALFPSEFEPSELGLIPKGWSVGRIGDIGHNPRAQGKPTEIPPTTPYVGLEHMPRRSLSITEWGRAATVESGKFWFQPSDILFGKLRPYFHKVGIATVTGVCSTDILVIRPKDPNWYAFLVMHLFSNAFIEHATQLSDGARMPRTNWSDTAAYKFALPPEDLAKRLNKLVQPMFSLMAANIDTMHSLASLRDHLLPRLISGKLRFEDAEEAVAAMASGPAKNRRK